MRELCRSRPVRLPRTAWRRRKNGDKTKEKEEAETEREGATDSPLLDLSDDAVKKMIKAAKKRGYVTMTS